jgi:hypothetical protein
MLVEIPKWMFDAAHCATLRLTEQPHVDCATLRTLKNSIAEQRVSVKAPVLQPQLSRQAAHGDTDGSSFKKASNNTTAVVRRTTRRTALARSDSTLTRRGSKTSGATPRQCLDERPSSCPSRPGRA